MDTSRILKDLKSLNCSGSFLCDFVEQFPDSCHVRDLQTKKYLMANHHMVNNCGLQCIDDIVGFTQHAIWFDSTMQNKRKLSPKSISFYEKSIQFVNKIENQVLSTKRPINTERFFLNNNGNIIFEHLTKFGVQNHKHEIIALLSVFINLTDRIPLIKLFRVYQEFYSNKEAIQKFLKHFDIEGYFEPLTPLTYTEVQVLIAMRDDTRHKTVASRFGFSNATANNHINNIQRKLKSGTVHDVLLKLPAIPENAQNSYAYI